MFYIAQTGCKLRVRPGDLPTFSAMLCRRDEGRWQTISDAMAPDGQAAEGRGTAVVGVGSALAWLNSNRRRSNDLELTAIARTRYYVANMRLMSGRLNSEWAAPRASGVRVAIRFDLTAGGVARTRRCRQRQDWTGVDLRTACDGSDGGCRLRECRTTLPP